MSRQLKIKPSRKRAVFLALLFVCVIVAGGLFIRHIVVKPVDCNKVLQNAQQLAQHHNDKQAYAKLQSENKTCAAAPDKTKLSGSKLTKARIQAINYVMAEAKEALIVGDNDQAYQSVNQVLNILKPMTAQDKTQLPNNGEAYEGLILHIQALHQEASQGQ
ncbi:MAG TPA: hypothetical protein VIJ68_04805 [Candidatus Saccharimonadales bacterium]